MKASLSNYINIYYKKNYLFHIIHELFIISYSLADFIYRQLSFTEQSHLANFTLLVFVVVVAVEASRQAHACRAH